jgi:hypothetical protein
MILALVFTVLALLLLFSILYLARTHPTTSGDLDQLAAQLRPVDLRAFRNLMAPSEEQYLRENLPLRQFRMIHRERMLAASEYVRSAAQNAAILVRLGEAARRSSDTEVVAAAEKLLDNALRLRLYAFRTVPRLYLAILFPGISRTPQPVADAYDTMTRQVVMLGCLQFPTHGMASAL